MKDECGMINVSCVERMILSHKGMISLLGRDESALVGRIRKGREKS